jgi:hypothetical protein
MIISTWNQNKIIFLYNWYGNIFHTKSLNSNVCFVLISHLRTIYFQVLSSHMQLIATTLDDPVLDYIWLFRD